MNNCIYQKIGWKIRVDKVRCGVLLAILFGFYGGVSAQPVVEGWWTGFLTQGKDTFALGIHLNRTGELWVGQSISKGADGRMGRFMITATQLDSGALVVQEVRQLAPEAEKWCIKHFQLLEEGGVLRGTWGAKGCGGGAVVLRQSGWEESVVTRSPQGKWTGRLTQSDRDYGFYIELELGAGGEGTSTIVSEGSGGQAWHTLRWALDSTERQLAIQELAVRARTDSVWKWCIKQSDLVWHRTAQGDSLSGKWVGQIEGRAGKEGRCAPGYLFLSRSNPESKAAADLLYGLQADRLEDAGERNLSVQHQIDVDGPDLRLQVWDNGTVDGDVVSVFLNGTKLASRLKVQKTRHSMHVHLEQDLNLLVVVADDIGSISPNTVAISVFDGKREQILIMNADMKENGGVVVRQFRRPE